MDKFNLSGTAIQGKTVICTSHDYMSYCNDVNYETVIILCNPDEYVAMTIAVTDSPMWRVRNIYVYTPEELGATLSTCM